MLGRELSDEEWESITANEIRDAINHSGWGWCNLDLDLDGRLTRETRAQLNAMSVEELKALIDKGKGVLVRLPEPMFRNVFPIFTKGARKGEPNFEKEPEVFWDRWHNIIDLDDEYIVVRE